MPDYYLCDWRIRSEITIPELTAWVGDDREPDVMIRLGEVPALDPTGDAMSPFMGVNPDMSVRLDLEDAAQILVRDGRDVIVSPAEDPQSNGVRVLILGAVLAILCHQRGLFPLHASCVHWDDGAVAFAGPSGAGKSTLAAALRGRGHVIVSDDVCAIEVKEGVAWVRPSFPRVKLWRDSMEMVGLPVEGMKPSGDQKNKFHFRFTEADAFDPRPIPLRSIYLIGQAGQGEPARVVESENAISRVAGLYANVARRPLGLALGRQNELFGQAGEIAKLTGVHNLIRCIEPERMAETLAVLKESL